MATTELGKAFEYACLLSIYNFYHKTQDVEIVRNDPFNTAENYFKDASMHKQDDLLSAAYVAVRKLDQLEPKLSFPGQDGPLYLSLQSDKAGQIGDVRDVLCVRKNNWSIGLSCKHNHDAVKHSRLSNTIDFGQKWFNVPCTDQYFSEIKPVFDKLDSLREKGKAQNREIKFNEIKDKEHSIYIPILNAFKDELQRLYNYDNTIPAKLVHYLMGEHDFYKVITDDTNRYTIIEGININGTLGLPSGMHKGIGPLPRMKLPSEFITIRYKRGKLTTIELICDAAWTITMRIHNAKSSVEPSLKFDIKLEGIPSGCYYETLPWDSFKV